MWMVRLALKNLFRNKRRIALSLVSVVAGVSLYILGQSFNTGLSNNIIRTQIDTISSHVVVRPQGYDNDGMSPDIEHFFAVDDAASSWLDQHAEAWTRRAVFAPEAIKGPDLIRLRGIVYDPVTDAAVFPRTDWQVDGEVPSTEGVLLGAGVADLMSVSVGDWIALRSRTVAGAINALEVPVVGVLRTGTPMLDARTVLLPWPVGQQLLRNGETASHLSLRLADADDADAIGAQAVSHLGNAVEYATWHSETADLMKTQEIRGSMFAVLTFALLAMAATGIANTILMAAYERVREIGTLRAMGMTRGGVMGLFVIEGTLLGLIGGLIGLATGGVLAWRGSVTGIDLAAMTGAKQQAMENMPFSMTMYMDLDPTVLVLSVLFGVGIAVLASIYPAIAATSQPPADAVRA